MVHAYGILLVHILLITPHWNVGLQYSIMPNGIVFKHKVHSVPLSKICTRPLIKALILMVLNQTTIWNPIWYVPCLWHSTCSGIPNYPQWNVGLQYSIMPTALFYYVKPRPRSSVQTIYYSLENVRLAFHQEYLILFLKHIQCRLARRILYPRI